jgi:hypothetical protein
MQCKFKEFSNQGQQLLIMVSIKKILIKKYFIFCKKPLDRDSFLEFSDKSYWFFSSENNKNMLSLFFLIQIIANQIREILIFYC